MMCAVFSAVSGSFLRPANIANIFLRSTSMALVGAGSIFVMICADIDLSGGSMMALTSVLAGKMLMEEMPVLFVIVLCLIIGGAVSLAM